MDDNNPPRALRNHHGSSSSSSSSSSESSDHRGACHMSSAGHTTTATRKSRYAVDDAAGDRIECTGSYCKSCCGALIADCVALCCCPCAVVNFLTLAFVKVPWMVGRKCLGLGKRKGQKRENKRRKCKEGGSSKRGIEWVVERGEEEGKIPEVSRRGGYGEEETECGGARLEAERVWLELYQIGHLGFGRVSFTGTQSLGNKGQLGNVN
ncbi:uncharacterized protein LOC103965862 [Pyrus x bretschneideri]|uniref:uncharacterized protein LOC103965862 n=1 Tax=Pyrus x bretschneideri TaxID=225117 RepID=UPI00202F444B|nr:uncharacterized protein LOC103965862 [Pyrus x bretschneideri]